MARNVGATRKHGTTRKTTRTSQQHTALHRKYATSTNNTRNESEQTLNIQNKTRHYTETYVIRALIICSDVYWCVFVYTTDVYWCVLMCIVNTHAKKHDTETSVLHAMIICTDVYWYALHGRNCITRKNVQQNTVFNRKHVFHQNTALHEKNSPYWFRNTEDTESNTWKQNTEIHGRRWNNLNKTRKDTERTKLKENTAWHGTSEPRIKHNTDCNGIK